MACESKVGTNCTITHQYHVEDAVSELLNDIEYLELINTHAPASNAILDPNASRTYKLTITYNRSRQAQITKELIEIISGAEAL